METIPFGGIIAFAVLLPNLIVIYFPPKSKPAIILDRGSGLAHVIIVFERIGQIGSFTLPFFYRLKWSTMVDTAAIIIMVCALIIYNAGWTRYLVKGRSEVLFYKSMLGIPLPMAILPVIYFISASVLLGSYWLMMSSILLGIGHITISTQNFRSIENLTVIK